MKITIIVLLATLLSGCASMGITSLEPSTTDSVSSNISFKYDEFDKASWLQTAEYYASTEIVGGGSVKYFYRARLSDNNEVKFVQLYTTLTNSSWLFVDSIKDSNGNSYDFIKIDREVGRNEYMSNGVKVEEHYGISLDMKALESIAENGVRLKFNGRKGHQIAKFSPVVSKAFMNSLKAKIKL